MRTLARETVMGLWIERKFLILWVMGFRSNIKAKVGSYHLFYELVCLAYVLGNQAKTHSQLS